jgi:hypothetical protein
MLVPNDDLRLPSLACRSFGTLLALMIKVTYGPVLPVMCVSLFRDRREGVIRDRAPLCFGVGVKEIGCILALLFYCLLSLPPIAFLIILILGVQVWAMIMGCMRSNEKSIYVL